METSSLVRVLLDALPVPVFYKARDGRYLGVNAAFSEFTGYSPEEVIGQAVVGVWDAQQAERYKANDDELFASGASEAYETKMKRADGEMRDVVIHKSLFHSGELDGAGIVGAFLDVTDRKRAERASSQKSSLLVAMLDQLQPLAGAIGTLSDPQISADADAGDQTADLGTIHEYAIDISLALDSVSAGSGAVTTHPDQADTAEAEVVIGPGDQSQADSQESFSSSDVAEELCLHERVLDLVDNLPPLSATVGRLASMVGDDRCGAAEFAAVLGQDPSLVVSVLRESNSVSSH